MSEYILVGTDGSKAAMAALLWAAREARRRARRLFVLCAYDADSLHRWVVRPTSLSEQEARHAVRAATDLVAAVAPEVEITEEVVARSSPTLALLERSERASSVVVGTHGTSVLPGTVLGTTADQVAAHASVPVVLVRPEPVPEGARDIVVGVDGSPGAGHALATALETAVLWGARVRAVRAWTAPASMVAPRSEEEGRIQRWRREDLQQSVEPWAKRYPNAEVVLEVVREHPVRALSADTRNTCLIVVGARGGHGFAGLALGSVARGVLYRSDRPVMVVHRPQT